MAAGGVQVSATGEYSSNPAVIMTGAQAREKQRRATEMDELSFRNDTKLRVARGIVKMCQGTSQWAGAAREFGGITGKLEDWEGTVSRMANATFITPGLNGFSSSRLR